MTKKGVTEKGIEGASRPARPDSDGPRPRAVARHGEAPGPLTKQAANLKAKAVEAIRLADPEALRSRLAFSEAHLDVLDQISSGLPVKGAVGVLAAARLRLEFTLAKPAVGVAVDQRVTITVADPYADDQAIEVEVTPLPTLTAKRDGETAGEYAERLVREREAQVIAERAKAP